MLDVVGGRRQFDPRRRNRRGAPKQANALIAPLRPQGRHRPFSSSVEVPGPFTADVGPSEIEILADELTLGIAALDDVAAR